VLTRGRDHNPRYVAPAQIASGPTLMPCAGTSIDLDKDKDKVRGGVRGFPRVRIRGQRTDHGLLNPMGHLTRDTTCIPRLEGAHCVDDTEVIGKVRLSGAGCPTHRVRHRRGRR
jgi:hypothetical protein